MHHNYTMENPTRRKKSCKYGEKNDALPMGELWLTWEQISHQKPRSLKETDTLFFKCSEKRIVNSGFVILQKCSFLRNEGETKISSDEGKQRIFQQTSKRVGKGSRFRGKGQESGGKLRTMGTKDEQWRGLYLSPRESCKISLPMGSQSCNAHR